MWSATTHPLATVVELAQTRESREMTAAARASAWTELGMAPMDVYATVARLRARDVYKTMASVKRPGIWQDVYFPIVKCPKHPRGIEVYCKVQVLNHGARLVVVSFKERGSRTLEFTSPHGPLRARPHAFAQLMASHA